VNELRESLDEALRTMVPGEPPVEEAIRRGNAIRTRRRVTAIASVAAVAVLAGVGYPALNHLGAAPAPDTTTHRHISVTVVPPGRGAPAGEIASGTIDGKGWRVITSKPDKSNQCLDATGAALGPQPLSSCGPMSPPDSAAPVQFEGTSNSGYAQVDVGLARADVSYLLVRLSDGSVLTLTPVKVYGARYVAFASPASLRIDSATAYLSDGQYLTSIPFNWPGGLASFGAWRSPGQPVPAQSSKLIGSGSAGGSSWSVRAYVGPWGVCFVSTGQSICTSDTAAVGTQMITLPGDSPGVVAGAAGPGVRYIVVTMTDGSTLRVTPVAVGGQPYFAFYLSKGQQQVRGWAAYDAAGTRLSSGTLH
jgi:hypothetical protein